jgi:hypothetical protein
MNIQFHQYLDIIIYIHFVFTLSIKHALTSWLCGWMGVSWCLTSLSSIVQLYHGGQFY